MLELAREAHQRRGCCLQFRRSKRARARDPSGYSSGSSGIRERETGRITIRIRPSQHHLFFLVIAVTLVDGTTAGLKAPLGQRAGLGTRTIPPILWARRTRGATHGWRTTAGARSIAGTKASGGQWSSAMKSRVARVSREALHETPVNSCRDPT